MNVGRQRGRGGSTDCSQTALVAHECPSYFPVAEHVRARREGWAVGWATGPEGGQGGRAYQTLVMKEILGAQRGNLLHNRRSGGHTAHQGGSALRTFQGTAPHYSPRGTIDRAHAGHSRHRLSAAPAGSLVQCLGRVSWKLGSPGLGRCERYPPYLDPEKGEAGYIPGNVMSSAKVPLRRACRGAPRSPRACATARPLAAPRAPPTAVCPPECPAAPSGCATRPPRCPQCASTAPSPYPTPTLPPLCPTLPDLRPAPTARRAAVGSQGDLLLGWGGMVVQG